MGYGWRYLYPIVPVVFIMAALGIGVLAGWMQHIAALRRTLVQLGIILIMAAGMLSEARPILDGWVRYGEGMRSAYIAVGLKLAAYSGAPASPVLATSEAGAVPYYSGWTTIDTYGLTDPTIALSGQHDPAYVLDQQPDVLVLVSRSPEVFEPEMGWDKALYEASLEAGMKRAAVLRFYERFYLWVMAREGSDVGEYLEGWEP
jgi:hypothetical protein